MKIKIKMKQIIKQRMKLIILEKKLINCLLYYLKIIIGQIIILIILIDMKMNRKKIIIFRIIQIN